MTKPKVHKVEWWSNQKSGPPVIFAGEVSECGSRWVIGSHEWRWVTCARCRKRKPKPGRRKP